MLGGSKKKLKYWHFLFKIVFFFFSNLTHHFSLFIRKKYAFLQQKIVFDHLRDVRSPK